MKNKVFSSLAIINDQDNEKVASVLKTHLDIYNYILENMLTKYETLNDLMKAVKEYIDTIDNEFVYRTAMFTEIRYLFNKYRYNPSKVKRKYLFDIQYLTVYYKRNIDIDIENNSISFKYFINNIKLKKEIPVGILDKISMVNISYSISDRKLIITFFD